MKNVDFYEACDVPTSLYEQKYAELNIRWLLAKKIYEQKEKGIDLEREGEVKQAGIPFYLHFIWLGGELPKEYEEVIQSWRINNPKYNIFIWGDDEVNKFMDDYASTDFRDLYEQCENYGQKSDILRYLILANVGGVYSDIDFICLENMEKLHNVNFFAGICLERDFQINNGLIGCAAGHPIMVNVFKRITLTGFQEIECPHTRTLYQTGPWALTDAVNQYIFDGDKCPNDVMFWPPNYFHPFPAAKRHDGNWQDYIKDYSKAVHLWECSWQK
jgi:inositol phosphorylceramide mannosyltransferase catalytic subunit